MAEEHPFENLAGAEQWTVTSVLGKPGTEFRDSDDGETLSIIFLGHIEGDAEPQKIVKILDLADLKALMHYDMTNAHVIPVLVYRFSPPGVLPLTRDMRKVDVFSAFYRARWPDHCRFCQGHGRIWYDTPSNEPCLCPECVEIGMCPRCGQNGLTSEECGNSEQEGKTCHVCGWRSSDGSWLRVCVYASESESESEAEA